MLTLYRTPLFPIRSLPLFEDHLVPLYQDETDDELVITADIPGIEAKDLDISLNGRQLRIRGKRGNVEYAAGCNLISKVESSSYSANCKNGVLTIRFPKTPEAKPIKILVS